jgi:hypothetical protein
MVRRGSFGARLGQERGDLGVLWRMIILHKNQPSILMAQVQVVHFEAVPSNVL